MSAKMQTVWMAMGASLFAACQMKAEPVERVIDTGADAVCTLPKPDDIPEFQDEFYVDNGDFSAGSCPEPPEYIRVTISGMKGSLCKTCPHSYCSVDRRDFERGVCIRTGNPQPTECTYFCTEDRETCTWDWSYANGTFTLYQGGDGRYRWRSEDGWSSVEAWVNWCSGDAAVERYGARWQGTVNHLAFIEPARFDLHSGAEWESDTECEWGDENEIVRTPSASIHGPFTDDSPSFTAVARHVSFAPDFVDGDFNLDQKIDQEDEAILTAHYRQRTGATALEGDMDHDGDVDDFDVLDFKKARRARLKEWQDNYGTQPDWQDNIQGGPNCDDVPGDYDGDGDVDGRDFLALQRGQTPVPRYCPSPELFEWSQNYGTRAEPGCDDVPGDYDGDGDVDGRDFLAMQRGATPVPRRCPPPSDSLACAAQGGMCLLGNTCYSSAFGPMREVGVSCGSNTFVCCAPLTGAP
jgi:hypothetical protein